LHLDLSFLDLHSFFALNSYILNFNFYINNTINDTQEIYKYFEEQSISKEETLDPVFSIASLDFVTKSLILS